MRRFCVQGVIRDGQVVLEIPLDLPDGELVIVTDTPPDDVEFIGPTQPPPPELVKKMILGLAKRNDLLDDPDWQTKLGLRGE
jgi:hypothetical protein